MKYGMNTNGVLGGRIRGLTPAVGLLRFPFLRVFLYHF